MASLSDERARYAIRVQGRLEPRWAEHLGDLKPTIREGGGQTHMEITDLTGWITDQAALMGVLEQLYARGLTLLKVERLSGEVGAGGDGPGGELPPRN
ncbi:MAG TPA: hypothetical protein VLT82_08455 [Myxococcaceae bacterium]|nr:hypothetical protein [Myxococcaceae bacterium]